MELHVTETTESKTIELSYPRAKIGEVLAAGFFDVFSVIVLGLLLMVGTLFGVQGNKTYQDVVANRQTIVIQSGLYVSDETGGAISILSSLQSDTTKTTAEKDVIFDSHLTAFFTDFIKEGDVYASYKKNAENNGSLMFDSDGNRTLTNADYDIPYFTWYSDIFTNNALNYLQTSATYVSVRNQIVRINVIAIFLTFFVSSLVFYLLFPLNFTRGKQTLGMKIAHLALLGPDAMSCSGKRFACHFLFSFFLIFWGSVFAFLIPFAISLTVLCCSKAHQRLADYVCNAYLVSTKDRIVYKDKLEYKDMAYKTEHDKDISLQ